MTALPGPPAKSATDYGLISDFNRRPRPLDELKLGPAPLDPKLAREVLRVVKDEDPTAPLPAGLADLAQPADALTSALPAPGLATDDAPAAGPPLVSPFPSELPPYPSTLRTIDVAREVEKVREARKRIKLGGEAFQRVAPAAGVGAPPNPTDAAKPSVCLFTVHDAGER